MNEKVSPERLSLKPRTRRRHKNFQVGATEKIPKNSKKDQKIALLSLFQGVRSNGKKDRKIALLSLHLLYLYHV